MKVLVLTGSESGEREVSLVTAKAIETALAAVGFESSVHDFAPEGVWQPNDFSRLLEALDSTEPDVVLIALHGGFGEGGQVQSVLDLAGVPYTGSGVTASAVALDKSLSKRVFEQIGVATPAWTLLGSDPARWVEEARGVGEWPLVVKPNRGGSTVDLSIARDEVEFIDGARRAARSDSVLVEAYVPGRELTCAVVDGTTYPIVEIEPESGIYDYESKYTAGRSRYTVPAKVGDDVSARVRDDSRRVYETLGCRGAARVDFRLDPSGRPHCLEVNTVPGMTPTSLLPMATAAEGLGFDELVEQMCRRAFERS